MPTRCSACCMDSAVAFSLGRSARYETLVSKPLGWPHCCNSCLAESTSPFGLDPKLYRSIFCAPGICGGSRLVAMSPPPTGPPYARW